MNPRSILGAAILAAVALAAPARADNLASIAAPKIDDAIAAARAAHKPLLLEFSTSWCHPCQEFERTVMPDPRAQAAVRDVAFVRYDAEIGTGVAAAAAYHVSSYPTFLAVDPQGVERMRHSGVDMGSGAVTSFEKLVAEATESVRDEAAITALLAAHPHDAGAELSAARWYAHHAMTAQALAHYDAVAGDPHATRAAKTEAWRAATHARRVDQWTRQLVDEAVAELGRQPADSRAALAVATVDSGLPHDRADALIKTALAATTETDDLNGLIYVALAAGDPADALAAATRMVAADPQPGLLDTLAECHHVAGDHAEALRIEDTALAKASGPTLASLQHNRERFARGTGDAPEVSELHAAAAHRRTRLDAIGGDAPASEQADLASGRDGAMAFVMASTALGRTLAIDCRVFAVGVELAYARASFDASGHITRATVLLDSSGTTPLRACIEAGLATAALPTPPPGMATQSIAISFLPQPSH